MKTKKFILAAASAMSLAGMMTSCGVMSDGYGSGSVWSTYGYYGDVYYDPRPVPPPAGPGFGPATVYPGGYHPGAGYVPGKPGAPGMGAPGHNTKPTPPPQGNNGNVKPGNTKPSNSAVSGSGNTRPGSNGSATTRPGNNGYGNQNGNATTRPGNSGNGGNGAGNTPPPAKVNSSSSSTPANGSGASSTSGRRGRK